MNCPQCDAETAELTGPSAESIHVCAECGEWLDGSVLNALLLHSNLPGLASLGVRLAPDEATGTCPTCKVSLVRLEKKELFYEACEECGGTFFPFDPPPAETFDDARERLIDAVTALIGKKRASK